MAKLVALDFQTHKHLRVNTANVDLMSADLNMVPVVTDEFLKLVVEHPILFTKNAETGQFVCVSLNGLEKGENLFWQNGQSSSLYTPMKIARNPFFVGLDNHSASEYVLCIDIESPLIGEQGEALFTDDGEDSHYLKHAKSTLRNLLEAEANTTQFITTLVELSLLTPLQLDITYENGESSQLNGLYSVDEEKLEKLDNEKFSLLKSKLYLSLIYTQIASLGQIYSLIDKKNKRNLHVK